MMFITAYYAKLDKLGRPRISKVHVLQQHFLPDGEHEFTPVCGSKPFGEVNWCAFGIMYSYLTCPKCKENALDNLKEQRPDLYRFIIDSDKVLS